MFGRPASTKQYRAWQGQQRVDAVRVAALNALCVSGQRHEGSESEKVGVALPKRTAAEATVENAAKFQGEQDAMLASKVNKFAMDEPQTAGNAANVSGAAERRKATNEPTRTRLRGEQKAPSVLHSG